MLKLPYVAPKLLALKEKGWRFEKLKYMEGQRFDKVTEVYI